MGSLSSIISRLIKFGDAALFSDTEISSAANELAELEFELQVYRKEKMPFQEFTCSGCNRSTISSFDLTDRPHLDCSGGIGYWVEDAEHSVQPTVEACPPDRHVYYTAFLSYLFCPYCGERLHSG